MSSRRLYALCALIPVLFACGGSESENGIAVEAKAPDSSLIEVKAVPDTSALQLLGKHVFFDKISNPPRQACVTCHVPEMGWTGKVPAVNKNGVAIRGANPHTVGGRKPPSSAYASFSPPFECNGVPPGPICDGGGFWDGRAEGRGSSLPIFSGATPSIGQEIFGGLDASVSSSFTRFLGPIADQALGPFGNDVEQNVPSNPNDPAGLDGATAVCEHVKSAKYAELYSKAYGLANRIDCTGANVGTSFKRIALALSAWQHSSEVNSFSSPRDKCAKDSSGNIIFPCASLSKAANLGHDIFYGVNTTGENRNAVNPFTGAVGPLNANCAICHNSENNVFGPNGSTGNELGQLYTDHAFHNIGLPSNYEIENFNPNNLDRGLGARNSAFDGHVKTPTLRNVDKRRGNVSKAYMHNGYFKTLEDVVHFYNTAAEPSKVNPGSCAAGTSAAQAKAGNCWPAAAFQNGTARGTPVLGRLGLTAKEEAALVEYMKSFSDTSDVKAPHPYKPSK